MIGHVRRQLAPLAADLDDAAAFRRADPFDAAARKLALVGHVEQPILEARRAQVGDEDLHGTYILDRQTTLRRRRRIRAAPCTLERLRQVSRDQAFGRTRNDVAGDQLADLRGGGGAGFDGRPHAADVAADDGGHVARRRSRSA